ncbi:MAG: hypothetical protein V4591_07315 [Bdellovibrionota bacterium]
MQQDITLTEVAEFLQTFKENAQGIPQRVFLVPRSKNLESIAEMGFTEKIAKEAILNILPIEYSQGPLLEKNYNFGEQELWVFGKDVFGFEVYIKTTVGIKKDECKCLSFHKSERPMIYIFKTKE